MEEPIWEAVTGSGIEAIVRWLESHAGNLYFVERDCLSAREAIKCCGATLFVCAHPCAELLHISARYQSLAKGLDEE